MRKGADEDLDFPNNGDIPPLVPDGDYDFSYSGFDKKALWAGEERLFLFFQIQTPGPFFGDELYMACTVPRKGKWRPSMKYWLNWVLAHGKRPTRNDRLPVSVFRNKIFRGRVRTVLRTSKKGIVRTREQQYSVIDELLAVLVG